MRLKDKDTRIVDLIPSEAKKILTVKGKAIVEYLGKDVIQEVTYNVLCGLNLRDSTEPLTSRRIGKISSALLVALIKGIAKDEKFIENLPKLAASELKNTKKKADRWFLEWILCLTDKGVQNILRDNPLKIDSYAERHLLELKNLVQDCIKNYGDLSGAITIKDLTAKINWAFLVQLFGIIGSQTLAIRGSEKSTYGKLFEKLILGAALSIIGFRFIDRKSPEGEIKNIFWLSERADKRESDATALCEPGKGIRFDIGFIGRGNPEITLDKVSRFERELEFNRQTYDTSTFVLVDRIGEKSRIENLAKKINGTIIQMSMSYWPKQLAIELERHTGFKSEISKMDENELSLYMRKKLSKIDLNEFL